MERKPSTSTSGKRDIIIAESSNPLFSLDPSGDVGEKEIKALIFGLRDENFTLQELVFDLKEKLGVLEDEYHALKMENHSLKTQNENEAALKMEVDTLRKEVAALQAKIDGTISGGGSFSGDGGDQLEGDQVKTNLKAPSMLMTFGSLNLTDEKKSLMRDSVFYPLVCVKNQREISKSLVFALAQLYNPEDKSFKLNNDTSIRFCEKEVAVILGVPSIGKNYLNFLSKKTSTFPPFVHDLALQYSNASNTSKLTPMHLKEILTGMSVEGKVGKSHFVQLMCYFILEQGILCSNKKTIQSSNWAFVESLEDFESINWAHATLDHIFDSLKVLNGKLNDNIKHYSFVGATSVLEALVFSRIETLRPGILKEFSNPPIQQYKAQRSNVENLLSKLTQLTVDEITPCKWCGGDLQAIEVGVHSMSLQKVGETAATTAAPQKTTRRKKK